MYFGGLVSKEEVSDWYFTFPVLILYILLILMIGFPVVTEIVADITYEEMLVSRVYTR